MYKTSKSPLWPRDVTNEEEIKVDTTLHFISNSMTDHFPTMAYSRCATISLERRGASQLTVAL